MARWDGVTLMDRFLAKTCPEPNTGCLLWTGSVAGNKGLLYGSIRTEAGHQGAHRVAYFLRHGRWPEPCALHRCDTPMCVNADHLFEGTKKDNTRDAVAKGRTREQKKTACPNGHPYDVMNSEGKRMCSTCARDGQRARYRRRCGIPQDRPVGRWGHA